MLKVLCLSPDWLCDAVWKLWGTPFLFFTKNPTYCYHYKLIKWLYWYIPVTSQEITFAVCSASSKSIAFIFPLIQPDKQLIWINHCLVTKMTDSLCSLKLWNMKLYWITSLPIGTVNSSHLHQQWRKSCLCDFQNIWGNMEVLHILHDRSVWNAAEEICPLGFAERHKLKWLSPEFMQYFHALCDALHMYEYKYHIMASTHCYLKFHNIWISKLLTFFFSSVKSIISVSGLQASISHIVSVQWNKYLQNTILVRSMKLKMKV